MGNWKIKIFKKRTKHRMGQTSGSNKGLNCQADWKKKYFACHPHAYRLDPQEYRRREEKVGTKLY